ncbi:PepSY-associated TM helix domain-containing protein [Pelagerythrobacter marinus]|uniref:PepSY-associated TM helix domain-containing protein n=1 Tax=Pelagerythrobacter marinus TaxID=538382 RepID=UPI002036B4ED|nr:PepSY domain-containing protein [Pelagerythrobacter marinus]USA38711.1 PepSY domain-containing protein [Pelagerythrobacter marinus]WPZ07262.1 PepSY domain-containing protein [Pelagerythrobacter marinus]
MADPALYRRVWRWHFYAGLLVLPFVLLLSVTGAIYLFKPQIDRWEERAYHGPAGGAPVSPDAQLAAALAAHPGSRFVHYRLPERAGDAAMVRLTLPSGEAAEVFVSPAGDVLGTLAPEGRISPTVARLHGSLLMGTWGDRLVELAASWTIVLIVSGLYLWWPRPFRAAGTLWPRLSLRGRPLLRDIHRVTGFWIAGLVLVMLASGLPWAGVWGSAFKWARAELGLVEGPQEWKIGSGAAPAQAHDHAHGPAAPAAKVPAATGAAPGGTLPLSAFVARAREERLAFPALVLPPHAPQAFGPPTGNEWTATSMTQNRPRALTVTYDPATGAETGRRGFADKHPIDRAVGYGIAWHEGQLFGLPNQLIGLATAIALIAVSLLGAWMWWKRRPRGQLAAPPRVEHRAGWGLRALVIALAILLPLFALSLVAVLILDRATTAWRVKRRVASA